MEGHAARTPPIPSPDLLSSMGVGFAAPGSASAQRRYARISLVIQRFSGSAGKSLCRVFTNGGV